MQEAGERRTALDPVIPECPAGAYPESMNTDPSTSWNRGVHRFRVRERCPRPGTTVALNFFTCSEGGADRGAPATSEAQTGARSPRAGARIYRFWSLRGFPYLLLYDAEAEPPAVLRFVHQSRDLPRVLDF